MESLQEVIRRLRDKNKKQVEILKILIPNENIYEILNVKPNKMHSFIKKCIDDKILDEKDKHLMKKYYCYQLLQANRDIYPHQIKTALTTKFGGTRASNKMFYHRYVNNKIRSKMNTLENTDDNTKNIIPKKLKKQHMEFEYKYDENAIEFESYTNDKHYLHKQTYSSFSYIADSNLRNVAGAIIRERYDKYTNKCKYGATFRKAIHQILNQGFVATIINFSSVHSSTVETNFRSHFIAQKRPRNKILNESKWGIRSWEIQTFKNIQQAINLVKSHRQIFIHFDYDQQNIIKPTLDQTYDEHLKSEFVYSIHTASGTNVIAELFGSKEVFHCQLDSQKSKYFYVADCIKQQIDQCKFRGKFKLTGNRNDSYEYELKSERRKIVVIKKSVRKLQKKFGRDFKFDPRKHQKVYYERKYYLENVDLDDPRIQKFASDAKYQSTWKEYLDVGRLYIGLLSFESAIGVRKVARHWKIAQDVIVRKHSFLKKYTIQEMRHTRTDKDTGETAVFGVKYYKSFFDNRYVWKDKKAMKKAHGIRNDVDPTPAGIKEILRDLEDVEVIPEDFDTNLFAVNYYLGGKHGLKSHFDDQERFSKCVYTYSLGSESRLTFGKTLNDTGISMFGCDLPVGLVLKMDLESFAGAFVKHGITPETLLATRAVVIFREVADWKLEEAKLYTKQHSTENAQ